MHDKEELEALALGVESFLEEQGLCLTMGGEPTFIVAQPDAAEWNTAAMGPEKLGYARRMAAELVKQVYPGALAMQVFGKWYPGEPLPRWNLVTLHHRGGVAIWPETERLLLDDVEGPHNELDAERLMRAIASRLGCEAAVFPVVESVDKDLKATCAGWVLPLDYEAGEWISAEWPFDAANPPTLFEGDSPIGLRLPLGDLPKKCSRKALTVEVRRGAIELFVPPLDWPGFRAFIDCVRALVVELDLTHLLFCGYGPEEAGEAVLSLGLAADPGVLEVNLPPCANWKAYDTILRQCSVAAYAVGLQSIKYQLNGGVYGTGGGAHLAFGGPDAARNPFLQNPVRIASLLRYWQRHPALSYFFTGQHVGPGSQAPRVDEGPRHGLYELEVACEGLEATAGPMDGIVIDQFLKNLLTDSSGNTHRAELCFDKFHNLSSPNGTLGIIELRAFETFPEPDTMSVVALFIRTILARLIKVPYRESLLRFGPDLHDRYFLPAFLWEDIQAICEDLAAHGFPFPVERLRPVLDFRSPSVGRLVVEGGFIDLRQAFESFPLMAEESQGAATVRVVDNSSDRLQLTLSDAGLMERGRLLVNKVEVPFAEVDGRLICGLRYKCASAYPALHPHVPIQSPLEFEWVSRETGITVAAARYHFWNPHGPVYKKRPANAEEARQRREERWQAAPDLKGGQPQPIAPRLAPEYRYTLDLRRQT